jgi:hypothetical protein
VEAVKRESSVGSVPWEQNLGGPDPRKTGGSCTRYVPKRSVMMCCPVLFRVVLSSVACVAACDRVPVRRSVTDTRRVSSVRDDSSLEKKERSHHQPHAVGTKRKGTGRERDSGRRRGGVGEAGWVCVRLPPQ